MATETITPKNLAGLKVQKVQARGQHINMLIYGDSGTGKTTLAGSADAVPAMRPVLFIDIEGGTESLRTQYPNVETVRVTTWNEMQQVYNELHRGGHGYQTIVLDSLTEIQKFSMYNIMGDLVRSKPDVDPDIPGMREWGKNIEQIRRFVRGFRDLPVNTIFTALAKSDKDARTGVTNIKPSLSGKVADEVSALLDIVCYYYTKQVPSEGGPINQRLLLTQKTEGIIAKDRSTVLPQVLESPTMKDIFKYVHGTNVAALPVTKEAPASTSSPTKDTTKEKTA